MSNTDAITKTEAVTNITSGEEKRRDDGLRIFPAPAEIGYAQDEGRLAAQGGDAFAPDPDGLVLSRDWQLFAGERQIPVYAAPVTSGGPVSFAVLEYGAGVIAGAAAGEAADVIGGVNADTADAAANAVGGATADASLLVAAGVTLRARSSRSVKSAHIRPASLNLSAELVRPEETEEAETASGGAGSARNGARESASASASAESRDVSSQESYSDILIPIPGPGKYILETDEDRERPLFIMVHAAEENVPAPGDEGVIYYGPGLHEISTLALQSGQTVYVAGGAVLRVVVPEGETPDVESDWAGKPLYQDTFVARQASRIAICGRGIVDLSMLDWHARKAVFVQNCDQVLIEGITCVGTSHWTIHLSQSRDCVIRDLLLIGYRENSDGIDIVNSERVRVDNCLIRTGDDAVVVKAMAEPPMLGGRDIRVRNCTVWNDKVRCFGITGETRTDISDVVFENCDIVHSRAVWTEELGSLCIIVGDSGTISNIRFENMRIEDEQRYAMACLIFKDRWSVDQTAGRIRNIVFRNIHIPAGVPSLFQGFDKAYQVEQIEIEGLYADERRISNIEQANFNIKHANGIQLK